MEMTAGCLTLGDGEAQPIDLVLSLDGEVSQSLAPGNGSLVGPHFMDDEYSPNGIGIWIPRA
jgi:hypothetical protein